MEIGSRLKEARIENGLTQEQTADVLGVSRQTISNWENDKSYPDIISVVKMSEIYSISLDHLLKEENSMNKKQTYMEYLEESTNTVKAKRNLEKVILFSVYFLVWTIAEAVFWLVKEPVIDKCDVVFRWILLPLLTLVTVSVIEGNNYWGKANWVSILAAAAVFFTVPYTKFITEGIADANTEPTMTYVFRWPNWGYMVIGVFVALCGFAVGSIARRRKLRRGV